MQPTLCSGSKNICINFAFLNLKIRHFQIPILQFSLCLNYAKSFVFLRFAQEPNISAQLALFAVLMRYFFSSTFTGWQTLFTLGFYRQMDKEIYKVHNRFSITASKISYLTSIQLEESVVRREHLIFYSKVLTRGTVTSVKCLPVTYVLCT